mgnify:CR=1 FL=1
MYPVHITDICIIINNIVYGPGCVVNIIYYAICISMVTHTLWAHPMVNNNLTTFRLASDNKVNAVKLCCCREYLYALKINEGCLIIEQASLSTAAPVFRIFGVLVLAFVSWRHVGFEGMLGGLWETG